MPPEFEGANITSNIIKNSGMIVGMSGSGGGQAEALNVSGDNYLIQYNEIDSTGYVSLGFNGSNVLCKNNFVNYFCMVKDDGGGIYTGNPQSGVVISDNIVLNGLGQDAGTGSVNSGRASGIYCDDNSTGIQIFNNFIANMVYAGIYLHNANHIEVRGNSTYNCQIGLEADNNSDTSYTTNLNIKNNIFVADTIGPNLTPQNQICLWFKTSHPSGNDIANFGSVDSNYYARPIDDNLTIMGTVYGVADNFYSLSTWQTYSGFDAHSHKSPKAITDLNDLIFKSNPTNSSLTISLPYNYIDLKGVQYNGTIILSPYTGAVLIKNGAVNQLPIVNAGGDGSVVLPVNSVRLDGVASDADGTITAYQWTKFSGPASGGTITSPTTATTNITGMVEGVYVFRLTVTDNSGGTAYDDVQVTVFPPANQLPTVNAGGDGSVVLPVNSVQLDGVASDPDGTITTYQWTKFSGPASGGTITSTTTASTNITGMVEGVYVFRLTVTDNSGGTAYDDVQVTVFPPANQLPTVNAGGDGSVVLPVNSVRLDGVASDPDGTITAYEWTKFSGPETAGTITSPTTASTNITGMVAGVYVFRLTVTDNGGGTAYDDVQVTVFEHSLRSASTNQTITPSTKIYITAYPNPFNNYIEVNMIGGLTGKYKLMLVDALGKMLWIKSGISKDGIFQELINTSDLAEGIYFFKIYQSNNNFVIKLVK